MDRLISEQAVIAAIEFFQMNPQHFSFVNLIDDIKNIPSAGPKWIPVKWHTITDEEREREGYSKEWVNHVDCVMPEDGQVILVTIKGRNGNRWVDKDTNYIDDGFYLDSGYDWVEDVVAWCELPKFYEPQESENES